jgi:hypothetical protein
MLEPSWVPNLSKPPLLRSLNRSNPGTVTTPYRACGDTKPVLSNSQPRVLFIKSTYSDIVNETTLRSLDTGSPKGGMAWHDQAFAIANFTPGPYRTGEQLEDAFGEC